MRRTGEIMDKAVPPFHRGRLPPLRLIILFVAIASIVLPALLVGAIVAMNQGRISQGPLMRSIAALREVRRALQLDAAGTLAARPGYASPVWLDLVIADSEGRVVFSTLPSLPPGIAAGLESVSGIAATIVPQASFFSDVVELDDRVAGTWYAILPSDSARAVAGEGEPLLQIGGQLLFALVALLMSIAVAAYLAAQIGRLERAAVAIAAGDLETTVSAGGSREIARLADAMEAMRSSIREDLGRRSRFLAAISHDLRTPLTSIGGYLEAIEDGLASDPETLSRYVETMKERTRVLEERIQALIEFARMETGEWRHRFEPLPLGPLFEGFAATAAEECALEGTTFASELSALSGREERADRALLGRAFENLVANALRHGKKGGKLCLKARAGAGGALVVDIDDDGPGIPELERERAFEAFYRGSGAREGEGSGLGLHIARSILRGHGWDLIASASPSGGARLSILIPGRSTESGLQPEKSKEA
jgi:signal transduction histidine kinase